jgi:hypothetical protein
MGRQLISAILDFERLLAAEAFRTILLALKDGPAELGPAITGMLLLLSNNPETRQRLVPGADVEVSCLMTAFALALTSARTCRLD